jgi:hypothetical protein
MAVMVSLLRRSAAIAPAGRDEIAMYGSGGLLRAVERPDQTRRPPISRRRGRAGASDAAGAERETEEGNEKGWD